VSSIITNRVLDAARDQLVSGRHAEDRKRRVGPGDDSTNRRQCGGGIASGSGNDHRSTAHGQLTSVVIHGRTCRPLDRLVFGVCHDTDHFCGSDSVLQRPEPATNR
jgi:hypothetical protein